ncbi:MAG: hypothetical protein Sylvanvirus9_21 [Sylvanvirus sp.]|uniref:Uncharacterized protein n=1 Tax=Sylvanvirus sp. TaxID=2487774 RepID=A0A3G5AJR0_9VIRU|nr:MAG: hypothetical protein Sylvanvirus9_21 [Sylvanvirus sp.]
MIKDQNVKRKKKQRLLNTRFNIRLTFNMSSPALLLRKNPLDIYESILNEWDNTELEARQEGNFERAYQAERKYRELVRPMLPFVNNTARDLIAHELLVCFDAMDPTESRFGDITHIVISHIDVKKIIQRPQSIAYTIYQSLLNYRPTRDM